MMEEWNNTAWTDEERLNDLKLQLCRKFKVLQSDIYLEWVNTLLMNKSYQMMYRLRFRVGRDLYQCDEVDIEVFINEIQNALLKDQIREDKLNALLK